ncbi:MAG TPA: aldehyde dehydrogenase family protein [Actinomycetota bacterium]|nr:aldehyde dehydrogenase family protein [Actinomycetota bacterium]
MATELLVLGGEGRPAAEGKTFAVIEPGTGAPLSDVAEAGPEDARRAVDVAVRAFDEGPWPRTPATLRGRVLLRTSVIVRDRLEDLASLEARNVGKPIRDARDEIGIVADTLEYWGGAANKIFGETVPIQDPGLDVSLREPVGVCALITPWNFPLVISTWKIAPALACGNTIVVKPASYTPLSVLRLAEILVEAGLPPEAISVLPGPGSAVGNALVTDPRVNKVGFTGSTEVGSKIMALAARNITRVSLELGGKSANVVFADADMDTAIERSVWSVFGNTGQDCCARSRVLVERSAYDDVVAAMAKRTDELRIGPPLEEETELGPMISAGQRETSLEYLEIGQKEGARLVTGGDIPQVVGGEGGFYLRPAVLADVRNDTRVAQEEIFGPVACLIPFDTEEEAIRLANETEYGLSGSIWTRDLGRAIRVAKAIRTGVISVNSSHSVHTEAPFGGYKRSGIGREMGMHAVNLYTEVKNVYFSEGS